MITFRAIFDKKCDFADKKENNELDSDVFVLFVAFFSINAHPLFAPFISTNTTLALWVLSC